MQDFGGDEKKLDYGYTCSPLVLKDRVIVQQRGNENLVLAMDTSTGQLLWKCGKGPTGYSSPIPYQVDGKLCVAVLTDNMALSPDWRRLR